MHLKMYPQEQTEYKTCTIDYCRIAHVEVTLQTYSSVQEHNGDSTPTKRSCRGNISRPVNASLVYSDAEFRGLMHLEDRSNGF